MPPHPTADVYTPAEIARAAGVRVRDAVAAIGSADALLRWPDAVSVARALARNNRPTLTSPPLFAATTGAAVLAHAIPLGVSGTVHVAAVAVVLWIVAFVAPPAARLSANEAVSDPMRLVFLVAPGPGGGGGGGGTRQSAPPPTAMREGRHTLSSPIPARAQPAKLAMAAARPIDAEPLPVVVAPIVASPADARDQAGVVANGATPTESRGSGSQGGVGTGAGTGIGEGNGVGVGPGSGGGTGGGVYRPGSGIEPPRVLREVKADYTEDARRRGIQGDVVLEVVVHRDGSVGDVRLLEGLGAGLDERAVDAVRQWRFSPARRLNVPVAVVVEVAVEFHLR